MAKTGRKRTTYKGAQLKLFKRTAVSYQRKLEVLVYLDKATRAEIVTHFHPGLTQAQVRSKKRPFYAWEAVRSTIEAKCSNDSRLHCRGRSCGLGAALPAVAEEQLVEWINYLRGDRVPVTALMVKCRAIEMYSDCDFPLGAFTATWSWRKHFLRRHRLVIRRRTHIGQTTSADAFAQAEEFSTKVCEKMKALKITKVFNAD